MPQGLVNAFAPRGNLLVNNVERIEVIRGTALHKRRSLPRVSAHGFSLPAEVWCAAHQKLEHLCR